MSQSKMKMQAALTGPVRTSPLLSAVQFAHSTRTTGGATMNVHTGELASIGDPGHIVGGALDRTSPTGSRVPTGKVRGLGRRPGDPGTDMNLNDIQAHRQRIKATGTNDPRRSMGSWATSARKIDVDAVENYRDRRTAVRKGRDRKEDAIFDLKRGQDINLK